MSTLLKQAQRHLQEGDYAAAEELCRKALSKPGLVPLARRMLADCLYNQGMVYVGYRDMAAAERAFLEAVEQHPAHALSLNNLGVIKERAGEPEAAVGFYLRALKTDPKQPDTLRNLAVAYQRAGRLEEAEQTLKSLAALDPANAGLYLLRQAMLIEGIVPDAGYPERVRAHMHRLLDECLLAKPIRMAPEAFAVPYFYLSYHGLPNRALHAKIAQVYLHLCPSLAWRAPNLQRAPVEGRRIRIGIASSNLFNHSIGHTSRGFVEQLDRELFEVIVIRLGASPNDEIARAIDAAADAVHTVSAGSLAQAREQIAALSLDILFYQDIGMHPFSYFLSFARLAPVQLTSFGHPDTTGVPNMDYFLSSSLYELEGAQEHYSEQLVLVENAGTLSYYHLPTLPAESAARAAFGLRDDEHLYFCPQTLFKIHPDMDRIFAAITERDPKARIVLIDPKQGALRAALEKRFARMPAAARERISFVERMPHVRYLQLMQCADVMLDTVHFNGQNTNLEAFSMALPVITLPGVMQRERHTAGMLAAMGHELAQDLQASDSDDYADKAVSMATNPAAREDVRRRIAAARAVLYRNEAFIRACEAVFLRLAGGGEQTMRR